MTELFFGPLVMQAYKGEKLHFIPILRIKILKIPYLGSEILRFTGKFSIFWKNAGLKDLANIMSVVSAKSRGMEVLQMLKHRHQPSLLITSLAISTS